MGCAPSKRFKATGESNETVERTESTKFEYGTYLPERTENRLVSRVVLSFLSSPKRLKVVKEAPLELEFSPNVIKRPVFLFLNESKNHCPNAT